MNEDTYTTQGYYLYSESSDVINNFKDEKVGFKTKKEITIYKNANLKEKVTTIPSGVTLTSLNMVGQEFEMEDPSDSIKEYLYISYNGEKGWIHVSRNDIETFSLYDTVATTTKPVTISENSTEIGEEIETTVKEDNNKKSNTKETIIKSVIIAVSLSIVAIFSIVLIHKKRKGKKEETQETTMNDIPVVESKETIDTIEKQEIKEDNVIKEEGNEDEKNI